MRNQYNKMYRTWYVSNMHYFPSEMLDYSWYTHGFYLLWCVELIYLKAKTQNFRN